MNKTTDYDALYSAAVEVNTAAKQKMKEATENSNTDTFNRWDDVRVRALQFQKYVSLDEKFTR